MSKGGEAPNTNTIQQACVIPFRYQQGVLKFCLITSLKKKKWIFPKGVVEPGETVAMAGLKEAWEEAGLRGEVVGAPVGQYADEKWGSPLDVQVLLMAVHECVDDWPEMAQRQRCWMSAASVSETLSHRSMKALFAVGHQRVLADGASGRLV